MHERAIRLRLATDLGTRRPCARGSVLLADSVVRERGGLFSVRARARGCRRAAPYSGSPARLRAACHFPQVVLVEAAWVAASCI
jgi:hypothetical protein